MNEWEWIALAGDAVVALLFWKLYKNRSKEADAVEVSWYRRIFLWS